MNSLHQKIIEYKLANPQIKNYQLCMIFRVSVFVIRNVIDRARKSGVDIPHDRQKGFFGKQPEPRELQDFNLGKQEPQTDTIITLPKSNQYIFNTSSKLDYIFR